MNPCLELLEIYIKVVGSSRRVQIRLKQSSRVNINKVGIICNVYPYIRLAYNSRS